MSAQPEPHPIATGDQVRIVNPQSGHVGRTGTVVTISPWGNTITLAVRFDGSETRAFFVAEVERVS
jgi:hypothetical protein